MNENTQKIAAPTVGDIRKKFDDIEKDLQFRNSAFERNAIRNYLLHIMLSVTNRVDDIFTYDTAVEEPEYVFFDTGKRIQGRDAILAFHRERTLRGVSLCVPVDHRLAIDAWGFAAELTTHTFLPDMRLERVRSALVWRCDQNGRMKSLRFYPAAQHETLQLSSAIKFNGEDLNAELSPLISRLMTAY